MTENTPRPVDPVDPFTFVLHGSSGDLSRRKILPALAHLAAGGYFRPESRIILAQRNPVTADEALAQAEACVVDQQRDVAAVADRGRDLRCIADVELDGHHARQRDAGRVACGRIDLARTGCQGERARTRSSRIQWRVRSA